ncbi:MAG: hypothetical protein EXS09_19585 [Gemmataceae bacterium]|nr:hypothetical protein [Gemmataceae bacterium]
MPCRLVHIGSVSRDDGICGREQTGPIRNWRDTSIQVGPEFMAERVRFAVHHAGTKPRYWALDNEPMLWHETHRDVRTSPMTYDELWERTRKPSRRPIRPPRSRASAPGVGPTSSTPPRTKEATVIAASSITAITVPCRWPSGSSKSAATTNATMASHSWMSLICTGIRRLRGTVARRTWAETRASRSTNSGCERRATCGIRPIARNRGFAMPANSSRP